MINTTTPTIPPTIENMAQDQIICLHTPEGKRLLLAKPFFNVLQQHFPGASLQVLETLLKTNAAFGLHIAKQHGLFVMENNEGSGRRRCLH